MIQLNNQKRLRAKKNEEKQGRLHAERKNLIVELTTDYDKLRLVKEEMEREIDRHKIYEDYLQTIVDAKPEEFKTVRSVYNKFASLYLTRTALTNKIQDDIKYAENVKSKMVQEANNHDSALTGLKNRLAQLHLRHSTAQARAEKWDSLLKNIREQCGQRLVDFGKVRESIWSIYKDLCKRKKLQLKFDKTDFENQLWFIKKTLDQLSCTLDLAKKENAKSINSLEVEYSE